MNYQRVFVFGPEADRERINAYFSQQTQAGRRPSERRPAKRIPVGSPAREADNLRQQQHPEHDGKDRQPVEVEPGAAHGVASALAMAERRNSKSSRPLSVMSHSQLVR